MYSLNGIINLFPTITLSSYILVGSFSNANVVVEPLPTVSSVIASNPSVSSVTIW